MSDNRTVTGGASKPKKTAKPQDDETVICTTCGGETSTGIEGEDAGHVVCEKCGNQTPATEEKKK